MRARRSKDDEYVGFDDRDGLWLITGPGPVGQACCDPVTFGGYPVEVAHVGDSPVWRAAFTRSPLRAPAVPMDARAQALLRMVWPATTAQAGRMWGCRIGVHAEEAAAALAGIAGDPALWPAGGGTPIDRLACAVVGSVFGVCGGTIQMVRGLRDQLARTGATTPVAEAALPLAALREVVDRIVRKRAAEPVDALDSGRQGTVVDELLAYRGLGPEQTPLGDVTALCCALLAAAWDATAGLLPYLIDILRGAAGHAAAVTHVGTDAAQRERLIAAAMPPLPLAAGWLRRTTQPVLLHGARIPADAACLLLVDPASAADPQPPSVATARWLAPATPCGAGMALARLTGRRLLAALASRLADAAKPATTTVSAGVRS
ncbi:hypothetical protein [Dactylosporangium darangshiense]|uniref:hypothetical protein n=1 Tax=Dactylosporangium darangshiense TaxID=579108 RepID=UPI0031E833CD